MTTDAKTAEQASRFLLALARGDFDTQLAEADQALTAIGLPWAIMAREALHAFVTINRVTAPGDVQPDGQGGFVPTTNSRINPKTGGFE